MKKIIIASGPVIVKDDKVLLNISSGDDFWKFCGGKAGDGESLKETAVRRAEEELGIEIVILKDEPFVMYTSKDSGDDAIDIILVHWLANYSGEIEPGADVEKWDWFAIDELPDDLGPNIIPALKHFGFLK